MGALINDKALYNNLNNITRSLNVLLDDLRVHPKRYVNISVFGKKDKGDYLTAPLPRFHSKAMKYCKAIVCFLCSVFFLNHSSLYAQQPAGDSSVKKKIIIINAERLNYQKKDSAEFQSAAGNVIIQQETTLFYSDSVVLNKTKNMLEAFGHVHINDNDSINTYSDYLRYFGNDKKAYLKGNVKLTDGKGTLNHT